jgi:hypothetical protein
MRPGTGAGTTVLLAVAFASLSSPAQAACRTSENKAHSFDTRLTPVPGQVCRMTVDVFAGGACAAPAKWQVMLPCDQTANTAISNNGRLISILLPRTKSQDLNVIRVSWGPTKFALASLRKLTGASPLRGEVRIDFDGDNLRLRADRTVVMPFETVRKTMSIVGD